MFFIVLMYWKAHAIPTSSGLQDFYLGEKLC